MVNALLQDLRGIPEIEARGGGPLGGPPIAGADVCMKKGC